MAAPTNVTAVAALGIPAVLTLSSFRVFTCFDNLKPGSPRTPDRRDSSLEYQQFQRFRQFLRYEELFR
jgi:hypothetical protein